MSTNTVEAIGELFEGKPEEITNPCSWNRCSNGHRWPVTMLVTACPGCRAASLAIKMENCPECNEPVAGRSIRIDHIPRGGALLGRCKGDKLFGESLDVEMECHHWKDGEAKSKRFEEKRHIERAEDSGGKAS